MVTRAALENMYKVLDAAKDALTAEGRPGLCNALTDDFGHELSAWDAWYDNGQDPHERPDEYKPTMANLNYELRKYGYKGIGGKNPRVVKL